MGMTNSATVVTRPAQRLRAHDTEPARHMHCWSSGTLGGDALACRNKLDWCYTKLHDRIRVSERASLHAQTQMPGSRAANARTQVYKWLLQELRPENHSTIVARNMVSTPRMVVRAYVGPPVNVDTNLNISSGLIDALVRHARDGNTWRCATMLPTLHVDINFFRQVNFHHLCCGSSIACSKGTCSRCGSVTAAR